MGKMAGEARPSVDLQQQVCDRCTALSLTLPPDPQESVPKYQCRKPTLRSRGREVLAREEMIAGFRPLIHSIRKRFVVVEYWLLGVT